MKIKSASGLIIGTVLASVVGVAQAGCYNHTPGWHMVSKRCHIKAADTWQEYASGVYTQPLTDRGYLMMK
jgi:hypothetical protein